MPLPTPNEGESEKEFIERCMSNETMQSEYPDADQRAAVCHSQWRKRDDKAAETKQADFEAKIEDIDTKEHTIVVKISTESVDRDKEVLLAEGCDLTDFRKNPIVLWAHRYGEPPIAKALWIKESKGQILSKPKFAPTDFAEQIFQLYADGFLRAWSVGFLPVAGKGREPVEADIKARPEWAGARWIYEQWKLMEYSAVPVPSNPDALCLAVKKGLILPPELKALIPAQSPDAPVAGGSEAKAEPEKPQEREHILVRVRKDQASKQEEVIQPVKITVLDDPKGWQPPKIEVVGDSAAIERRAEAWVRGQVVFEEEE